VDFVFYTKRKLAVVDLLDFPALASCQAVDMRRQVRLPDVNDKKPGPWNDEEVVTSLRSGTQQQQQTHSTPQQQQQQQQEKQKDGGVQVVELPNSNFMGKYAPRQDRTRSEAHKWLPNAQFCSDHFSLRCTFAFDEENLASAGWH
jgi:hypothetical protein